MGRGPANGVPELPSSTSAGRRSATRCDWSTSLFQEGVRVLDDRETVLATVPMPTPIVEPEPEEGEELEEGELPEGRRAPEGEELPKAPEDAPAEGAGTSKARRGPAVRLFRRGEQRFDAGPARRGPRQSGPRVRAYAHNAAGSCFDELARRHCASWRSNFVGSAGGDPARRPAAGAAEAGDVHERLGSLVAARPSGSSRSSPSAARRSRRRRPRGGPASGAAGGGLAGHNGLRSIAQHLGSQDFLRLRIGMGCPGRGTFVRSPTACSRCFHAEDPEALVARAADAVETIARDGAEAAQQRSGRRSRTRRGPRRASRSSAGSRQQSSYVHSRVFRPRGG